MWKIKKSKPFYNTLADVLNFVYKNNLKLLKLEKENNNYHLVIKSDSDNSKLIAAFIKYLIKSGYKNVFSKEIINKKDAYITQIRFSGE